MTLAPLFAAWVLLLSCLVEWFCLSISCRPGRLYRVDRVCTVGVPGLTGRLADRLTDSPLSTSALWRLMLVRTAVLWRLISGITN